MSQDDNARNEDIANGESEAQKIEPEDCNGRELADCTDRSCLPSEDDTGSFILVDHARFLLLPEHKQQCPRIKNDPGEMLVVTEDSTLLFALREKISGLEKWTFRWENHFWTALASLSQNQYAGLVFDMRINSLDEKYIIDFVQEYSKRSNGLKLFLSGSNTPNSIKRMLKRRGSIVLKGQHNFETLIKLLGLDK